MSKEDLQREDDLKKSFDSIVLLVNELQEEKTQIEIKFGLTSKLRQRKHAQQQTIKHFYRTTLDYINIMRDTIFRMGINYRAMELIAMQKETGLSWAKVATLIDFKDTDMIKKLDEIDAITIKLYSDLREIDPKSFK